MKCPKCSFENRSGIRFCEECGTNLDVACPNCGARLPKRLKFCGECGHQVADAAASLQPSPIIGQRKLVTILFSDLSGFTTMTEKMDSEEVKEIMDSIFGKIAQVITKYEGYIEKFIGDAAMAVFGAPKGHEDDAIRAIRAAREIHEIVGVVGSKFQKRIGQSLVMHSGIDSGIVVTGQMGTWEGTPTFTGDTINRASRLCSLAKPDEILVGAATFREAEALFHFENCETALVKGKIEPLAFYKVLSSKIPASKTHRTGGLQSDLIGRSFELAQLTKARDSLEGKRGSILSICGDGGTGKSRLIEEFKATVDFERFHWMEAYGYAYKQNVPYCALIDLLNRTWKIDEEDSIEQVRTKIKRGVERVLGGNSWVSSSICSLYGVSQPGEREISPEMWESQLYEAVHLLLTARTQKSPTVILIEDIHWADFSSLKLLRFLISELRHPVLFLCVYRPPFSLFTTHQLNALGRSYQEIRLENLSPSEAQVMLESILQTNDIPFELRQFIQEMTGGNPFYLEEVIHSLIESEVLICTDDRWRCTRPLSESVVCPTIQGVISARLDYLSAETKRLLQEASVIGRAFLYQILESVTASKSKLDQCLTGLERLDLVRTRAVQPDLEYVFKHALTHEVVYDGLLRKEREAVHEKIGQVMETLFCDRLPEFYETLAFHFQQGKSVAKAVNYLVKSGEKSLRRHAVDESHSYFHEAFELLNQEMDETDETRGALIDLLIKWAFVHYYSGHYAELLDRLEAHKPIAESLTDKSKLGMFYAWLGWTMWHRERLKGAHQYLLKALELGEEVEAPHVVGYACAWLTWTCSDLGFLNEAERYGERAQEIAAHLADTDQYMYFNSLAGLGYLHWHRGERHKAFEAGRALVEFGQSHFNVRSIVMGHTCIGFSHFIAGDYSAATSSFLEAMQVSADPWYLEFPRMGVCYARALAGQFENLEEPLREIISFGLERGAEYISSATQLLLGVTLIASGKVKQGLEVLENIQNWWLENGSRTRYVQGCYTAGNVFAHICHSRSRKFSSSAKDLELTPKEISLAEQKAFTCLYSAAEIAEEIGAAGHLSKCCLSIGLLHKAKGDAELARKYLTKALTLFHKCGAERYVKEAEEALASMEGR